MRQEKFYNENKERKDYEKKLLGFATLAKKILRVPAYSFLIDDWKMVTTLDERQKEIIKLRYGLENGKFMTYDEIGLKFGYTGERIGQLEREAVSQLRKDISKSFRKRKYVNKKLNK